MRITGGMAIMDAGNWTTPSRVVQGEDGEAVIEKFPSTPHEKYLNPAGHVVFLVLSGGASDRNTNNAYAHEVRRLQESRGGMPYRLCPPAAAAAGIIDGRWLTKEVREAEPCQPGTYDAENPCPHMIAERDARQARTLKKHVERETRHKSLAAKNYELQEKRAKMLEDALIGKDAQRRTKSKSD